MQDQESQLTLQISDFLSKNIPDRVWVLTYPDRTTFYLNDSERLEFLKQMANGNTIVQIGDLTLTSRFTYLYQFKNRPTKKGYAFVGSKAVEK